METEIFNAKQDEDGTFKIDLIVWKPTAMNMHSMKCCGV